MTILATETDPDVMFTPKDVLFIRRVVKRFIRKPQDAMDVVQNVLLKAYLSRETFHGDSKLTTWIYRIAVNESLMFLRSRRLKSAHECFAADAMMWETTEFSVPSTLFPESLLLRKEARMTFDRLFAKLLPDHRLSLWLQMEGMTDQQIAEATGRTTSSVRNAHFRARKALRDLYAQQPT